MHLQPRAPGPGGALANDHITVLRIKRKRGQEPLEALVLHQQASVGLQRRQRRKLLRGLSAQPSTDSMASEWAAAAAATAAKDPLMFAFGESITEADFGDAGKRRALQDRLATLSTRRSDDMDIEDAGGASSSAAPALRPAPHPTAPADAPQATFRVVGTREVPLGDESAQSTPEPPRARNWIPEVVAAANLPQPSRRVKVYDAVHEDLFDTLLVSHRVHDPYAAIALGPAKDSKVAASNPQTADELVPMVRDYLSLTAGAPEYVYDFYYIPLAQPGMGSSALRAANIGAVHWVDDTDDAIADSDCAVDDDDEDSNAEDFYRNDYPDEPDSASDMDECYYSSDDPAAASHYRPEYGDDDDDDDGDRF
ncbi:hypothetical protein IWQ57_000017 [Coemansia nantahalensis]|uniref:Uncharacterized protein n=1 Tax=Coemansia nantahalensis TaxID=2789366 RepID=A0ACC1K919_9FUNG|nr:hypothetical protein IWQ57_000017 [Coemansia nantahalensis]